MMTDTEQHFHRIMIDVLTNVIPLPEMEVDALYQVRAWPDLSWLGYDIAITRLELRNILRVVRDLDAPKKLFMLDKKAAEEYLEELKRV